jgi:hypothetical protein
MHVHTREDAPPAGVRAAPGRAAPVRGNVALRPGVLGNRAVGQLLRSLQRSPDWTKPQTNVAGSGITRLEVHGLAYGTGEFQESYGPDKSPEKSDEANKTAESPKRMAVVLVPDTLDPDRPVQIVVHFHGWGFRFDENAHDPYAGYLVAKGAPGGQPPAPSATLTKSTGSSSSRPSKAKARRSSRSSPRVVECQASVTSRRSSTSATCS